MEAAGTDSYELSESLAVALAMRGEIDLADERFRTSLTHAQEFGERLHLAAAHPYLEAGLMLGRYAETERVAREGIAQLREILLSDGPAASSFNRDMIPSITRADATALGPENTFPRPYPPPFTTGAAGQG